jgi:hypothetical protein
MTGGGVAELVPHGLLWVSLVAGAASLTALAVAQAFVGQRRNAATVALTARAFGGQAGPRLAAGMIVIGATLWAGFYVGVASGAVGYLARAPAAWAAPLVALGVWVVHRSGFRRWNVFVALTGVAALVVGVLVFVGVPVASTPPPAVQGGWPAVLIGAGAVVSYAAVFSVRVPDFAWDAPRRRDVVFCGGTLLATLLVFLGLGAGVYLRAGSWELADLVTQTRLPIAGAALLLLSVVAPTVSGMHSTALAVEQVAGWAHRWTTALVAVVATVLGATRFDLQLLPFLDLLGALVPPLLPVLLLDPGGRRGRAWAWGAWLSGAVLAATMLVAGMPAHVLVGLGLSALVAGMARLRRSTPSTAANGAPR